LSLQFKQGSDCLDGGSSVTCIWEVIRSPCRFCWPNRIPSYFL